MTGSPDNAGVPLPDSVDLANVANRVVIAAVRPFAPNLNVIAAAADIAVAERADLLVLATMTPVVTDWVNIIPNDGHALEAAQAELFADCVELLYTRELAWGVQVLWGHLVSEINGLGRQHDVRTVVLGQSRPSSTLHRLRRRFSGRLATMIGPPHTIVVPVP
jgi:K+-sensing histidine kinase KdpD